MPVIGEARRAKKEVHDVTRLLSRVVRGREERSEPMDMRVEDMTPVLGSISVEYPVIPSLSGEKTRR
jgi:hypothetical protein